MKISVIIPTYNRKNLIKRAIESVLSQTLKPHEIIVVDDGSTDNTYDAIKEYPIKYIQQKNQGVSSARNRGIKSAKGNVIAFLDSDDVWLEKKLELQSKLHIQDYPFTHTQEIWIRDNKILKQKKWHQKPDGDCFYENISFCKIAPSTVMINKTLFEQVGYFDESLEVCEDFDMWLRVLKITPIKLLKQDLTIKYAGEHEQLSFKYFAMDIFRIKALLKHLPDKRVQKEIEKKLYILQKGAKKHQNREILEFIEAVKEVL